MWCPELRALTVTACGGILTTLNVLGLCNRLVTDHFTSLRTLARQGFCRGGTFANAADACCAWVLGILAINCHTKYEKIGISKEYGICKTKNKF
jgi:hypothetical protein